MYERMLDKQISPSFTDMISYCGDAGGLWMVVDEYLKDTYELKGCIRFPYGNKYGWSMKYSYKNNLICDIFAEKSAFMVLVRVPNDVIQSLYGELSDYAKNVWDDKYPCGNGGWLKYRITDKDQLQDLIKILDIKVSIFRK